ncbi:DUF2840 domain-containing protein [Sphingopyxis sp.]|uniref:DUF2840 domain-containing protein n=1 Tax=Sphingopyxis sp. TaxID=1908224 RepID=UPI003BAA3FF0
MSTASGHTEVELTWLEGRIEQWIRFGRVAADRVVNRRTRIATFRPGAVFGLVRWTSNDFGTVHSSIAVLAAVDPGAPYSTHPFVRPGGDLLLRIDGWPKVQRALEAIDAIEGTGIDPCDVAPDHWRHVGSQLAAGLPFRPYGPDRHAAWLRRRALES